MSETRFTERQLLVALVATVDTHGGVARRDDGVLVPVHAPDWWVLADTYREACVLLGQPMKVVE